MGYFDGGPLIAQADAMELGTVALWYEFIGQMVPLLGQLLETDAGAHQFGVGHDVVIGDTMQVFLALRRLPITDKPAARDIRAHAVAADQIGIESDEFHCCR